MADFDGNPATVLLRCRDQWNYDEARAAGAITPGHLLSMNSDGEVVKHATAGGEAEMMFAVENGWIGETIDDAYADDDLVHLVRAKPGDELYSFLADDENVVKGDFLMSDGAGGFKKYVDDTEAVDGNAGTVTVRPNRRLAVSLEALDLTGVNNTQQRLKIRVI